MWTCDYCGETLRAAIARPGLRIPACDHLDRCHGSPARGGVGEHELWAIAQNGRPVAGPQGRRRHYLDIKKEPLLQVHYPDQDDWDHTRPLAR
jgi:hypothetical protein